MIHIFAVADAWETAVTRIRCCWPVNLTLVKLWKRLNRRKELAPSDPWHCGHIIVWLKREKMMGINIWFTHICQTTLTFLQYVLHHVHIICLWPMTLSRSRRGAAGEKAAKPMTAVQDCVSTSVSMDVFKESLRFFPAMFVVTKTGILSPNFIFYRTITAVLSQPKLKISINIIVFCNTIRLRAEAGGDGAGTLPGQWPLFKTVFQHL